MVAAVDAVLVAAVLFLAVIIVKFLTAVVACKLVFLPAYLVMYLL